MDLLHMRVKDFPKSWRALTWGYLISLSIAYVYALLNIALVVGLTPKDIMIHYYGADKAIEISEAGAVESEFSFENIENEPEMVIQPSLKTLVAEGHFHLFGMTSFFFGLCFLGLFTSISETIKCVLVSTPFVAVVIDNFSFLATRFMGPNFAYLTVGAGAVMFLCFSSLWFVIIRDLVITRKSFKGVA